MSSRTFVVTVSEAPSRVVVEDVRTGRRALAGDLAAAGDEIARLLEGRPDPDSSPVPPAEEPDRADG